MFISGRYRVDIRSQYRDSDNIQKWGRGVSYYLDEFGNFLQCLLEIICLARPDPRACNLPDLIRLLGSSLMTSFSKEERVFQKLKSKVDGMTSQQYMDRWVNKYTNDIGRKISWIQEAPFLKNELMAYVSIAFAKEKFCQIQPPPIEIEQAMLDKKKEERAKEQSNPLPPRLSDSTPLRNRVRDD